ncbi:MAG: GntR family transcriptional regulator [Bacillota bacterium]|nr:GntR family transcriptional regulator [Bacillota bacterium]
METVPLFISFGNILKSKIETGEFTYGDKLPTEEELSKAYHMDRKTVRKAKKLLSDEGLIKSIRSKGTYICKPRVSFYPLNSNISSFTTLSLKQGFSPNSKVILAEKIKAGRKYAGIFKTDPDYPLYRILRIRKNNETSVAIEDTRIRYDLIPNIEKYDFSVHSLYDTMHAHGIKLSEISTKFDLQYPSSDIANALNIPACEGILKLEFSVYNQNGQLIEYTRFYSSSVKINITV